MNVRKMSKIRSKKLIGIGIICMMLCVVVFYLPISGFFINLHFMFLSVCLGSILGLWFVSWRIFCWGLGFQVRATLKKELKVAGLAAIVLALSIVLVVTFFNVFDLLLAIPFVIAVALFDIIAVKKITTPVEKDKEK